MDANCVENNIPTRILYFNSFPLVKMCPQDYSNCDSTQFSHSRNEKYHKFYTNALTLDSQIRIVEFDFFFLE